MRHIILLGVILFTFHFGYAQISSIELPEGKKEIKVNQTTAIFSIYITENGDIFLEDEEVELHTLGSKLQYVSSKLPEIVAFRKKLFLFIDNNAEYIIVDAVKTQLAQAKVQFIYYKTETIEDKDFLKGESAFNYASIIKYEDVDIAVTQREKSEMKMRMDSLKSEFPNNMPAPPPPPAPPVTSLTFYPNFYSDRQEVIEEVLIDRLYKCLKISDKKLTLDESKVIKIDELNSLKEELIGLDFLILRFDENLTFKTYFNVLKFLKKEAMSLYEENDKSFHVIEISKELSDIYKLNKISLCN